ncbi:hypothetical protein FGA82_00505 [Pseudomonas fluorescens]|nr:hypothetical protein FGA82_00505 [Pseudomonas fluorescens]
MDFLQCGAVVGDRAGVDLATDAPCNFLNNRRKTNVGASLLAKAGSQSAHVLTDTTPSRASSLPQGSMAGY